MIVPCFAEGELALREADKHGLISYVPGEKDFSVKGKLSEKQEEALEGIKKEIKEFGSTGVQEVLNAVVFDLLKQICVFPAGAKKYCSVVLHFYCEHVHRLEYSGRDGICTISFRYNC